MINTDKNKVKIMTISGLLCALGILIPMIFPSFRMEPASYTLASHVPLFIATFISPTVTAFVAIVSTFGFFIAGFPIVVVMRALTHLVFSLIGAFVLKKNSHLLLSNKSTIIYAFVISVIHGAAEVLVVTYYYGINDMAAGYYELGYMVSVLLMVGVGTVIHSLVDFSIAVLVWKPIQQIISIPANAKIRSK